MMILAIISFLNFVSVNFDIHFKVHNQEFVRAGDAFWNKGILIDFSSATHERKAL